LIKVGGYLSGLWHDDEMFEGLARGLVESEHDLMLASS
jgi:hypothetical protein